MSALKALFSVLISSILIGCEGSEHSGDVSFAKKTFSSLVRGEELVSDAIDWETFTSMEIPVGPQYLATESEPQKDAFRKGFITQFSASYRDSGGSVESLSNWRATFHDENRTEVTADSSQGSLVLTVSQKDSGRKLSAMKIIK